MHNHSCVCPDALDRCGRCDLLLDFPGLHADALSWAAEAKKMGQAEPSTKGGPLVASSHLTRLGWLTGLEPATPATTTRCSTN